MASYFDVQQQGCEQNRFVWTYGTPESIKSSLSLFKIAICGLLYTTLSDKPTWKHDATILRLHIHSYQWLVPTGTADFYRSPSKLRAKQNEILGCFANFHRRMRIIYKLRPSQLKISL